MSAENNETKLTIVAANAGSITNTAKIVRFRGRPLIMERLPFPHYTPLYRDRFERLAYPILGGVSRSRVADVFSFVSNTAEDLTEYEDYILFGVPLADIEIEADTDMEYLMQHPPRIWDTRALAFTSLVDAADTVWRAPYPPTPAQSTTPVQFIMELAGGDEGVYDDIMQSLAPLVMARKPDGVIWWVGDGANGKSTLMDAIYRIFPGQLSSLTVKRLCDGRDTPSLNGTLANVVKESSEGRIEDTEVYKSIGTHENFRVHRFHSQDDIEVRGNMHHIFSANSVPTFNDKGWSARRRTFVIPFNQRFESDPEFERKTFTPQFFSALVAEMCRYAQRLRDQHYRYKWSARTAAAKLSYDTDANNAEEYARFVIDQGVVAFDSFNPLRLDYENWCIENGYVPLGITNLRRAVLGFGFERVSTRAEDDANTSKQYRLAVAKSVAITPYGLGRPGLYTLPGFAPSPSPTVPDDQSELNLRHKGW